MKKLLTSKKHRNLLLIILISLNLIFLSLFLKQGSNTEFKINEVAFEDQDWIEIYNPSFNAKSLKGYYLSDKKDEATKYKIKEDLTLGPNSFIVFYGENDYENNSEENIEKHLILNFNLKNGETIYLLDPHENLIDSFSLISSENENTQSLGRFPDGSSEIFTFSNQTPGDRNQKDFLIPRPNE